MEVFRKADVQHGQLHEARAKVAFRAALGSAACCALVFVPIMLGWSEVHRWVSTTCIAVGVFICFVTASRELGDTVKLALTWGLSTPVYGAVGLGVTYLCYLAGGLSWHPWVVFVALPLVAFCFILWGEAAAECHKPHPLFAGNHAVILMALLIPAAMLDSDEHSELLQPAMLTVGLAISILFGSVAALLLAQCPMGLGAAPAKRRVPSLAAAKLFAIADYADILALPWDQAPASLAQRRQLRFAAARAAVDLRRIRETAVLERCGNSIADSEAIKTLATNSEACRHALMLSHVTRERMAFGQSRQSRLGQELAYAGKIGEARANLMVVAARALRAAGSVAASMAGAPPVQPVPGETTLFGSGHSDAEECVSAANDCRTVLSDFRAVWEKFYSATFLDRLKELSGSSASEGELLDAFFSGRLEILAAQANSDEETAFVHRATSAGQSQIASLLVTLQTSADFMSVCSMAESAALVAEAIAEALEDIKLAESAGCRMPGAWCGFRAWLRAPVAGRSVWAAAFKKTGRHAARMSIAIAIAGGLALAVPQMFPTWNAPGFWTIATVSLCLTPTQGASLLKGGMRVLGTLLGASLGLASVTMAPGNLVSLWSHVFLVAYFLKFFEPELNYAGAVAFITYLFIIIVGTRSTDSVLQDEALVFAFHRVADVTLGVVITTMVSIFCLPNRAVDDLRKQEREALGIATDTISAACKMLSHAASAGSTFSARNLQPVALGPKRSSSSCSEGELEECPCHAVEAAELRARTWGCAEKLTFGGDGLGGAADMLSDVYWEARIGSDRGSTCLFGCLWTPFRNLPFLEQPEQLTSGENCLRASPFMNRLLRQCHILVSVLEPGLEMGAERILSDEKVRRALGAGGSGGLAECVDRAVGVLAAQLERPTADGGAREPPAFTDLERAEASEPALEEAVRLMQCLLAGAGEARARLGGVVGRDAEGNSTGAGGLRTSVIILMLHETVTTLTLVREALSGDTPAEQERPRTPPTLRLMSGDLSARVIGDSAVSPTSGARIFGCWPWHCNFLTPKK